MTEGRCGRIVSGQLKIKKKETIFVGCLLRATEHHGVQIYAVLKSLHPDTWRERALEQFQFFGDRTEEVSQIGGLEHGQFKFVAVGRDSSMEKPSPSV